MVLKYDLRYMKSEDAIRGAFLELLDEMPLDKISVTAICDRARCSRNAFYAHYVDKEALYDDIIEEFADRIHDVGRNNEAHPTNPTNDPRKSSADFFDTFMANRTLIERLLRGDRGIVQQRLTKRIFEVFMEESREMQKGKTPTPEQRAICLYGAGGNVSFMIDYILNPTMDEETARNLFIEIQSRITKFAGVTVKRTKAKK